MELNLKNLLTGPPNRLRYTFRYSTCRIGHPESVAEHSYYCALYSLAIGDWIYARNGIRTAAGHLQVDTGTLLRKAILHDLEECVSGDFPRTFKYSNPQTKDTLDKMAEIAMTAVVTSVFPGGPEALSMCVWWRNEWRDAKDFTIEGKIVDFADFLCVLGFMNDEADTVRLHHVEGLEGYYKQFQKPEYEFIRPLVDQAGVILKEISGKEEQKIAREPFSPEEEIRTNTQDKPIAEGH